MNNALDAVTEELTLALHTAVAWRATPQLRTSVYDFARYHRGTGASHEATLDLLHRLLDEAASSVEQRDPVVVRAISELRAQAAAMSLEAHDSEDADSS